MARIFSTNYPSVLYQRKIERAIEERNLDDATTMLDNIPVGYNDEERVMRMVTLNEGYMAILEEYRRRDEEDDGNVDDDSERALDLLRRF